MENLEELNKHWKKKKSTEEMSFTEKPQND